MEKKKLIAQRRAESTSMQSGYSQPEFNIVLVSCENGFCDSAGHSGFEMTDHNGEGFWEE